LFVRDKENKELPHASQIKNDPLHLLSPERAALSQASLTTGGLAEDSCAALADDNGLCVRENGGDGEAAGALDVHEEASWGRHKGLELVLLGLSGSAGVQQINGENHFCGLKVS
jgi:hypothetical protein